MALQEHTDLSEFEADIDNDVGLLTKYARYVRYCRRFQIADIITNTAYVNAQFIMEQLLLLALKKQSIVRLLTGRLENNTYNPLSPLFRRVLDAGVKIKILIMTTDGENLTKNEVYDIVTSHKNGRLHILNQRPDSILHFMLVGNSAYRVEINDTTKEAYACFKDKDGLVIDHYMNLFKEKWNEAEENKKDDDVRGSVGTN